MAELIELLDENGCMVGAIDRGIAHKTGAWHKTIHAWIINDRGEILLAQRSNQKSFYPSKWDCSFAGHVDFEETSIECAIREGKEEIGIELTPSDFEYLLTFKDYLTYGEKFCNQFADVFLIRKNINIDQLTFSQDEVEAVKWVKIEKFLDEILSKKGNYLFHGEEEYKTLQSVLQPKMI